MAVGASTTPITTESTADVAAQLKKQTRIGELIIEGLLFIAGAISILVTVGIVIVLARDAIAFFQRDEVTLVDFFFFNHLAAPDWAVWHLVTH